MISAELITLDSEVNSSRDVGNGNGSKWSEKDLLSPPETPMGSDVFNVTSTDTSDERRVTAVDEETCLICGDRASGYHYNALSCEGCKGFFRRSITRNAAYQCKYGGNCEMDMWMRRRCQACRLRRCREMGMKEECLLSEDQCRAREVRRKTRTPNQQPKKSPVGVSAEDRADTMTSDSQSPPSVSSAAGVNAENPLERVSEETREIIRKLVFYQDLYELPSPEDIERVSQVKISDVGRPKEMSEAVYQHMAEMTILVTQLVVEFAKKLPGFSDLQREDQINLLKASSCEVMMLRTARRYDAATDTVVFANGTPFTRDSMRMAGLQSYADCMFEFCNSLSTMGVDNAEYALLMALCIFADRPGLINPKQVDGVQSTYVRMLMEYLETRRPRGTTYLAKLLMKLTELRQLSAEHSDMLFALKVEKGSLPPLLCEYFDVCE